MPHDRPGTRFQMGCFVVAEFLQTSELRGPSAIAEPLVIQYRSVTGTHTEQTHRHTDRHTHDDGIYCAKHWSCGKNVSRDVTTHLSRTVCCSSAWTKYDQHVHQIGSLYVYSLRTYERQRKMQNFGWFGG